MLAALLIFKVMSRKDRQANLQMNQQTNETNLQMNRETNAANQMINQANIDYSREAWQNEVAYNWEMWNATNQYNSASAQRQRLEDAGLNPYMMMEGGNAGTASSSSAPSHNQPQQVPMQAGRVDPYYVPLSNSAQDVQNVIGAVGQLADVQLKRQQEIGMGIQNQYMAQKAAAEIANILADSSNKRARTVGQNIMNYVAQNTSQYTIEAAKKQPGFLDAQISNLQSQAAFNDANKELALMRSKQMPYELWLKAQDVLSQVDLRDKQGRLVSAQEAESRSRTALNKLEAEQRIKFTPQQLELLAQYQLQNAGYSNTNARVASETSESVPTWLRDGGIFDNALDRLSGVLDLFNVRRFFKPKGAVHTHYDYGTRNTTINNR